MSDPDELIDEEFLGGSVEKNSGRNEIKKTNSGEVKRGGRLSAALSTSGAASSAAVRNAKGKFRTFRGSTPKLDREGEREGEGVAGAEEAGEGAAPPAAGEAEGEVNPAYVALLERAKSTDLSRLDSLRFLYREGEDEEGRPLVVLVGAQVPAKSVDLSDLLLYAARTMDPIVHAPYSIVYFHTGFASDNKPAMSFLKNAYTTLSRAYKKNLKQLIIVHPSFWIKTCARVFRPFVSTKFWQKLTYISHTDELRRLLPDLTLPPVALASPDGVVAKGGGVRTR